MKIRGSLSNKSAIVHLLVWLVWMLFLFFFSTMVVVELMRDHVGVMSVGELKAQQFFLMTMGFLLPVLIAAYLCQEHPLDWLHLSGKVRGGWKVALMVIAFPIIASPGINLLSWLNEQMTLPAWLQEVEAWMQLMEESNKELTELFARTDSLTVLAVNLLVLAALPAVAEELTFRGMLQGLMGGKNIAIWVTAILFSAVHIQFYGFIPRMLLGASFGYLLLWTGSIWMPMLAHFTNNAMAAVCFYLTEKGIADSDALDTLGTADTWWLGAISLVASGVLLWFIYRTAAPKQSSTPLPESIQEA